MSPMTMYAMEAMAPTTTRAIPATATVLEAPVRSFFQKLLVAALMAVVPPKAPTRTVHPRDIAVAPDSSTATDGGVPVSSQLELFPARSASSGRTPTPVSRDLSGARRSEATTGGV